MTPAAEDVLNHALKLPPADRVFLAQELWCSLESDELPPFVIDDELMAEIRRREAEMDAGHCISHEELMASLQEDREEHRKT